MEKSLTLPQKILLGAFLALVLVVFGLAGRSDYHDRVAALSPATEQEAQQSSAGAR